MKDHAVIPGIAIVAVPAPGRRADVNFHVADSRRIGGELEHGAVKIGTGLVIPESRMKNAQLLAVQGPQLIAPQPLMLPDLL